MSDARNYVVCLDSLVPLILLLLIALTDYSYIIAFYITHPSTQIDG